MALSCDDPRGSDYSVVTRKSKRHNQMDQDSLFRSGGHLSYGAGITQRVLSAELILPSGWHRRTTGNSSLIKAWFGLIDMVAQLKPIGAGFGDLGDQPQLFSMLFACWYRRLLPLQLS